MLETNDDKKRIKNRNVIIIILLIMVVAGGSYLSYMNFKLYEVEAYSRGFNDGIISTVANIRNEASIPFLLGEGNNTRINWVPISVVCENE